MQFDLAGQISSIWNATIASQTGNHYTLQSAGWNNSISAGGSVSIGFTASPGGGTVAPANFVLQFVGNGSTGGSGGTSGGGTVLPPPPATVGTTHVFAPYVDMTLYPMYDLASAVRNDGIKDFTLAFIVADANQQPAWGGYTQYEVNGGVFDMQVRSEISAVRALGGDVIVSFGGAANQELAQAITNVTALKNAYESVVNAYQLDRIDFDIEGAAVADHASIDRRSQAIALLQQDMAAAGRPLQVWFTLPVLPSGLTSDGLYVLQSALKYGVSIGGVNVMAMDYGDGAAPNPSGQMGTYAIEAATSVFQQLQTLYGTAKTATQLWQMIGVTPMIGMNDITSEVFDLQAAQQLTAFAEKYGIGLIAMWSLNRDQQDPSGAINYVENTSSSIVQQPFAFSQIFEGFQS